MRKTINNIQYEFITLEWIEEQLRTINIIDGSKWDDPTNEAINTYNKNFALLIYNLFQRGLGYAKSKDSEFVLAGFDFNPYEINEGKSLNKTDLESAKARIYEYINKCCTEANNKMDLQNPNNYKFFNMSGVEIKRPITCTTAVFVLKYKCIGGTPQPYWQMESE